MIIEKFEILKGLQVQNPLKAHTNQSGVSHQMLKYRELRVRKNNNDNNRRIKELA